MTRHEHHEQTAHGETAKTSERTSSGKTKRPAGTPEAQLDDELHDALEATFPASDPVSVGNSSAKPERPIDREPPAVDAELVKRLARKVEQKS